jgi:hypothetical protein
MNASLEQLRMQAAAAQDRNAFFHICRSLAVANGRPLDAIAFAERSGAPTLALSFMKAAVGAGSTSSMTELVGNSAVVRSYMETLQGNSVFARALVGNLLHQAPFNTRVIAASAAVTANEILEGKPVRVRALDLTGFSVTPRKVGAITVATDELWRAMDPRGVEYVSRLLREACAKAVDTAVLAELDEANDFSAVLGDAASFATAFRNAVGVVCQRPASRMLVACSVEAATQLIGLDTNGQVNPFGGSIYGIPTVITAGIASGLAVIDFGSVVGEMTQVEIDASNSGSIQLDDDPTNDSDTPTPTNVVSMFATNTTAVRAIMSFAVHQNRTDVMASINLAAS